LPQRGPRSTVSPMASREPRPEPETRDTWDRRVLDQVDAGVDGTLIAENLRRTPTERLRRLQDWIRFLESQRDRSRASS